MKQMLKLFTLLIAVMMPLSYAHAAPALKKVEPQYVCMVNNAVFDKVQIPVEVNGKTYYGCCPMCKDKLTKSEAVRTATDPVSNKRVDKATAVIGATADGKVFYFENEKNLKAYKL